MPSPKDTLKDRLDRYRQIKLSVIRTKVGTHDLDTSMVRC